MKKFIMISIVSLLASVSFGQVIDVVMLSKVSCASVDAGTPINVFYQGEEKASFTKEELVQILLGDKIKYQTIQEVVFHVPNNTWINPEATHFQKLDLASPDAYAVPQQSYFFMISALNKVPRPIFCTVDTSGSFIN